MYQAESETALAVLMQRVSTAPVSLLLLDYDGTLAPFHVDRTRAYPYPGVISILERIVGSGRTRVIIISGRPVVELRALLDPMNGLEVWGSHGMERQLSDGSYSCAQVNEEDAASLTEARDWVTAAGLLSAAEIKLGGIAIHWRGMSPAAATDIENMTRKIWTTLTERSGLRLLQFEGGLELRVSHPDKGDAVRSILAVLESDVPIAYLGDDLTDEDAFHVLNGHGLSILVKADYRETIAGAWIRPPHDLICFFERWLNSTAG